MTVKHSHINRPGRRFVQLELDEESLPAVLTVPDGTQYFFTEDGCVVRLDLERAPIKRRRAAARRRD